MSVWFAILMLIFGLVVLCWSGDRSVIHTQSLARLLGVDTFFLGFVLLAVATGLPELAVVISSLSEGVPYLSVGDLIGSNFTDVALVLGLSIVIAGSLQIRKEMAKNIVIMWLFATGIMAGIFIVGRIGKIQATILILTYAISLWYLWRNSNNHFQSYHQVNRTSQNSKFLLIIKLLLSLFVLWGASRVCVLAAMIIVKATPLTYEVFGTTIIAVGTSLPEIILNVSAARRRDIGLAVGNSLGSVVEQGSLLLGILGLFSPHPLDLSHVLSVAPFIALSYAVLGYYVVRYRKIPCNVGVFLLILYGVFLAFNYVFVVFRY